MIRAASPFEHAQEARDQAACLPVYAQGAGGTLREIFEDDEQNFYAVTAADFTPMIFFDPEGFWEHDAEFDKPGVTRLGVNVRDLIQKVFRYGRADSVAVLNRVRFTVDLTRLT